MALVLHSVATAQAAHVANLIRVGGLSRNCPEWRMVAKFLVSPGASAVGPHRYVHSAEWHVRPPYSHLGVGDLVLTDGRHSYLVVEAKRDGTPERIDKVNEQARRYRRLFEARIVAAAATLGSVDDIVVTAATLVDGVLAPAALQRSDGVPVRDGAQVSSGFEKKLVGQGHSRPRVCRVCRVCRRCRRNRCRRHSGDI
jgi:hypothetical protein